jgi:hypothetical protein
MFIEKLALTIFRIKNTTHRVLIQVKKILQKKEVSTGVRSKSVKQGKVKKALCVATRLCKVDHTE